LAQVRQPAPYPALRTGATFNALKKTRCVVGKDDWRVHAYGGLEGAQTVNVHHIGLLRMNVGSEKFSQLDCEQGFEPSEGGAVYRHSLPLALIRRSIGGASDHIHSVPHYRKGSAKLGDVGRDAADIRGEVSTD
jgi:hypothetical protein